MPNIRSVQLNVSGNLVVITLPNRTTVSVTGVEAQSYIDRHPGLTDSQLETQVVTWIQSRWSGRQDTVAVHVWSRVPLALTIWLGAPGAALPANWWL